MRAKTFAFAFLRVRSFLEWPKMPDYTNQRVASREDSRLLDRRKEWSWIADW